MIHAVSPVGSYAPDFELPGINDIVHHLARYLDIYRAVGVVIMGNQCPYVQAYLERLKHIQAEFEPQGVTLIGINASDASQVPEDDFEHMKRFAASHQLNFPYLRDETQDVAQAFGATRTPHVFLIDSNSVICYCGAIDDSAEEAEAVKHPYLRRAIAQLLKGETIATPMTEPVGCAVKWRS